MTIELKVPTSWQELSTEQLMDVVTLAQNGMPREQYLLALFLRFSGVKMIAGTSKEDGKKVVRTHFKDAEGNHFDLDDWQLKEFCDKLDFVMSASIPLNTAWPFKWDRYLLNMSFEHWFRADALLLQYTQANDLDCLKKAMAELGDPHDDMKEPDIYATLMILWYNSFKDWLQERYPLVFKKAKGDEATTYSPIDARQNILLMLNENRPQENQRIEESDVHDVLAALQQKIEQANEIERKLHQK